MSTNPTTGDVTPATDSCCGNSTAAAATTETAPAAHGCCGSAEATAAGQCCTPGDRAQAIKASAGCCG